MKIQVLSDLHLEFFDSKIDVNNFIDSLVIPADVLVLAGDIGTKSNLIDALDRFCDNYSHVVYVTGNHEYYRTTFNFIHDSLHEIKNPNFHFLNDGDLIIDGQRFIGATMWFSDEDECNRFYKHMLNDFAQIMDLNSKVYNINKNTIECFEEHMRSDDIVVTHHMPLEDSIASQYKGNDFNRFFLCDMEYLIKREKPKLWIHGHTHCSFDYKFADTRIVCNPYGYVNRDINFNFDKNFIIEI